MTQPNEDRVRAASAAFGQGDLATLRDQFFAENIVWHIAGTGPLAGDYQGVAQVMELLSKISELSGGTVQPALHDVLVSPDTRSCSQRSGPSGRARSFNSTWSTSSTP